MRGIHFRAWDDLTGIMITSDAVDALIDGKKVAVQKPPVIQEYEEKSPYLIHKHDPNKLFDLDVYGDATEYKMRTIEQPIEILHGNPFMMKRLTLMQCTELDDRNGVEIYEGDLVKAPNTRIWEVCFMRGSFRYVHPNDESGHTYHIGDPEMYPIEVIGNIYENPDLLKPTA